MIEKSLFENTYRPKLPEWIVVFFLLGGIFVLNLITYNSYPTVWADEVLWSEPAINLVTTGHFTTSVWQFQPEGAFWAAQSPLYCFLLSGWLSITGASLVAVRSFNLLLMTIATFLVWFASWRYQLLGRPLHRVIIVPLLLLGYGVSFSYRCSRPDIAGLVSLVGLALAFSVGSGTRKHVLLFLLAAIVPWVGIQIGLFAFLACSIAKAIFDGVTWRDLTVVSLGLFVGGCSMLLFFYANGVLANFMASISQATHELTYRSHAETYLGSVPRRLLHTLLSYTSDFSCIPLLLGLVFFRFCLPRGVNPGARRAIMYSLAIFFVIPLIFTFSAHFAFYYSYMIYVPLVMAFLIVYSNASAEINLKPRFFAGTVFTLSILGAALVGLPLRLGLASSLCQIIPRSESARIIQAQVKPDDVVFADYTGFFEAKQVAHRVFSPMYARVFVDLSPHGHNFSDEEKSQINVLVIPAEDSEKLREYFGGKWVAVSEPFGDSFSLENVPNIPFLDRRIRSYLASPQTVRRKLQIWRRPAG